MDLANMSALHEVLPNEILEMIFDHLTFTEKLIGRLVCSKWNDQLMKFPTYQLSSRRSHQVLLNSRASYTSLKISSILFALPNDLKDLVTSVSLDVNLKSFHQTDCLNFILDFCSLKELSINFVTMHPGSAKKCADEEEGGSMYDSREELAKRLISLSFKFPYQEYFGLDGFLYFFAYGTKILKQIVLIENPPMTKNGSRANPTTGTVEPSTKFPFWTLRQLITTSASTLETLCLEFQSIHVKNAFTKEIFTNFKIFKENVPQQLTNVSIGFGSAAELSKEEFESFQEFIAKQKNTLESLRLPWISNKDGSGRELCQKFMETIVPRSIQKVTGLREVHVTDEFADEFQNLESVSMKGFEIDENGEEEAEIGGGTWSSVRQLILDSMDIAWEDSFFENLALTFDNLSELILQSESGHNTYRLSDSELHDIIESFKELKVLKIYNGNEISDYSVSGVDGDCLENLLKTKIFYLLPERVQGEELWENEIAGSPISSLKNLREFVLLNSKVTDAGIYLGFKFGSALKQLTFQSTSENVTDWGLNWLGENIPHLESFHGIFNMKRISSEGKKNLKAKFHLIQHTQKFKVVGVGAPAPTM